MKWSLLTLFCHLQIAGLLSLAAAFSSTSSPSSSNIVTRSYTLYGDGIDSNRCLIHEIRPPPQDPNEEEDEVESFYPTSKRSFKFPNHSRNSNKVLNIRQTSFGCGKLGATVWASSFALAALLANDNDIVDESSTSLEGKRVLELGSGCGLPSLVAKEICGADSILATDYWEEDVPGDTIVGDRLVPKNLFGANLAYNVNNGRRNSDNINSDSATVQRLDWHDEMGIFKVANTFCPDIIIGSDLVYYPMDTAPLLQTLEILLKAPPAGSNNNNINNKKREALLILPLPPKAQREALPDFRARLENGELGIDACSIKMDELVMVERMNDHDDSFGNISDDEGRHDLLRIQIQHSP